MNCWLTNDLISSFFQFPRVDVLPLVIFSTLQTAASRMLDNVLKLEDGDGPIRKTFKAFDRLVAATLHTVEFMKCKG